MTKLNMSILAFSAMALTACSGSDSSDNKATTPTQVTDSGTQRAALVGTWKQEKIECKSGSVYQAFAGGFSGSITSQLSFADTTVNATLLVSLKYDEAQGNAILKQIADAKEKMEQTADSPEKQKYLADLEKSKADIVAFINKYKDGYSCQKDVAGTFSTNGSELSTKTATVKNTCEGSDGNKESTAQYEVKGDSLIVTAQSESEDEHSCPKGDSKVMTYSRVNN